MMMKTISKKGQKQKSFHETIGKQIYEDERKTKGKKII